MGMEGTISCLARSTKVIGAAGWSTASVFWHLPIKTFMKESFAKMIFTGREPTDTTTVISFRVSFPKGNDMELVHSLELTVACRSANGSKTNFQYDNHLLFCNSYVQIKWKTWISLLWWYIYLFLQCHHCERNRLLRRGFPWSCLCGAFLSSIHIFDLSSVRGWLAFPKD